MDGDSVLFGTISQNTPIRTVMETSAAVNAAEGNEEESGREKPSLVVTAGDQNRTLGKLEDMVKPRPTDLPPGEVKPGGEFRNEYGVPDFN